MVKQRSSLDGLLGPLETDVMEVVWARGDATVRAVHEALAARRDIAYTTVMTTMSRLAAKGVLVRDASGLAHRYRPALSRDEYAQSTVHSVVDWLVNRFPEPAVSYFVDVLDGGDDPAVLDALRTKIEQLRATEG
jgi:predicted transcriptional regulator